LKKEDAMKIVIEIPKETQKNVVKMFENENEGLGRFCLSDLKPADVACGDSIVVPRFDACVYNKEHVIFSATRIPMRFVKLFTDANTEIPFNPGGTK